MTKKAPAKSFKEGDLIFAKVKGYPPWPARVTAPADAKGTKFNVFFFGTYETANVKREEMWLYDDASKARYGKQKRKGFAEAIDQIENNPGIVTIDQLEQAEDLPVLEGGVSGDTTVEESMLEESAIEPEEPEEAAPEVAAATPEPAPKPVASAKKSTKRKAESSPATPLLPPAKQAKVATPATPAAQATPNANGGEEKTSRSGRVIKPKKFEDDKNGASKTLVPDEAQQTPTTGKGKKGQEPRKMWVQVKATSDTIEINMDKSKPLSFESKEAEIEWERETAKNALRFKSLVESNQYIPEEIRQKLEAKTSRTPQEEEILRTEKITANRKEKVRWLKMEHKLIDLDIALKLSLHYQNPDMERCLSLSNELHALAVNPLMLKKQPDVVATIRKMRKYVGPKDPHPDPKTNEKWKGQVQKIRLKAESIYAKFQSLFAAPDDVNFGAFFEQQLNEFRHATKDMDPEKVLQLVTDPTA